MSILMMLRSKIQICFLLLAFPYGIYGQKPIGIDTSQVYLVVDSMPQMRDGSDIVNGIREIFAKDLRYPELSECVIVSTIIYEFTISYNGKVIDKSVSFRGNYSDCPEDYDKLRKSGLQLLDNLPVFKPGMHKGKYVKVKFKVPIHIHLQ